MGRRGIERKVKKQVFEVVLYSDQDVEGDDIFGAITEHLLGISSLTIKKTTMTTYKIRREVTKGE